MGSGPEPGGERYKLPRVGKCGSLVWLHLIDLDFVTSGEPVYISATAPAVLMVYPHYKRVKWSISVHTVNICQTAARGGRGYSGVAGGRGAPLALRGCGARSKVSLSLSLLLLLSPTHTAPEYFERDFALRLYSRVFSWRGVFRRVGRAHTKGIVFTQHLWCG